MNCARAGAAYSTNGEKAVAKEFSLPDNEEVLMILDLGYAGEGAAPLATHNQRKELSDTVKYL